MIPLKSNTILLFFLFFLIPSIQNVGGESNDVMLVDDDYNIEIIASQWQFDAIDLNRVDDLVSRNKTQIEARQQASYISSIGRFIVGKTINFAIRTRDVQHGFRFAYDENGVEQSIEVPTIRPLQNNEFGPYINASIILPSQPMIITVSCYIFCGVGHPNMKLTFQIGDVETNGVLDLQNVQFITIAIISVMGTSFIVFKLFMIKNQSGIDLSTKQRSIISDIFQSRTSLYFYLMGQKTNSTKQERIQKAIPLEIYKFKFLLHPIRLSMTKVLFENLQMTTIELKEVLGISWNDLNTHLTALQKKGYVFTEHKFIDGSRRQIAVLEPFGIKQYKLLVDLLHLFLDNISKYQIVFDDDE